MPCIYVPTRSGAVAEIKPTMGNCAAFARWSCQKRSLASVTSRQLMSTYHPTPGAPWSDDAASLRIYAIPVDEKDTEHCDDRTRIDPCPVGNRLTPLSPMRSAKCGNCPSLFLLSRGGKRIHQSSAQSYRFWDALS